VLICFVEDWLLAACTEHSEAAGIGVPAVNQSAQLDSFSLYKRRRGGLICLKPTRVRSNTRLRVRHVCHTVFQMFPPHSHRSEFGESICLHIVHSTMLWAAQTTQLQTGRDSWKMIWSSRVRETTTKLGPSCPPGMGLKIPLARVFFSPAHIIASPPSRSEYLQLYDRPNV
jgi:hypothetical protein